MKAANETIIANSTEAVELLAERPASNNDGAHTLWGAVTNRDTPSCYKDQTRCLKLLLSSGVNHTKMTIRMWAILDVEESARLLHAAGFTGFENRHFEIQHYVTRGKVVPQLCLDLNMKYYAKRTPGQNPQGNLLTLQELCRDTVRDVLLKHNARNLFKVVPRLPLPDQIKSYLLYNMSVDKCIQKGIGPLVVWGGGLGSK